MAFAASARKPKSGLATQRVSGHLDRLMSKQPPQLYFDFVDPISYLMEIEVRKVESRLSWNFERIGFELRPPPLSVTTWEDPTWSPRIVTAGKLAADIDLTLDPPPLIPWSRKAHELYLWASENGVGTEARSSIFKAYFLQGVDIGRIDELVTMAQTWGLDPTETKAVLDVDRFAKAVVLARTEAENKQIAEVPPIVAPGNQHIQGFHNDRDLSTLLGSP